MEKNLGVTRFEFYFVIAAIGLIISVGIQRYLQLAEETKRLNFEVVAKNFNAAVYNHHARWIMAKQDQVKMSALFIGDIEIQFSAQGWPFSIITKGAPNKPDPITQCLSLWNNLLQNAPPISYNARSSNKVFTYHLSLTSQGDCRYELITIHPLEYYFDYAPASGKITIFTFPITKNS